MNRSLNNRVALAGAFFLGQMALAGLAVGAFPTSAAAQLIIQEVCTTVSTACVAPGSNPKVRRGVTETIKIRGPFVDHTNLAGVTTGNKLVTISKVVGENCGAVGCLNVTLTVNKDFGLAARLVPIFVKNAFGTSAFNLFIVRRGEITAMTQNPAEPAWGDPVAVTIKGLDIGNTRAEVTKSTVSNHVEAGSGSGSDSTTFRVVAAGTPALSTTVVLGDDAVTGIAGNYRFTSTKRTVNYRAASGAASCVTTPGIAAPVLSAPANNQAFTFTDNPVQATITLRWNAVEFKPTEQFIIEIGQPGGTPASFTTAAGATSRTVSLPRNRRYQWRVRAYNCGQGNPPFSAYREFGVQ